MTRPMATEAALVYFDVDHADRLMITATFATPAGWQACVKPYEYLSPSMVQELDRAGIAAVQLTAPWGRCADFTVAPAGPLNPAYLK